MTSEPKKAPLSLLVQRLKRIAPLSDEEQRALEDLPVRVHTLEGRHDIVRDGEKPEHCCLLMEGWAFRYKLIDRGRRQILSFHVPGDMPDLHGLRILPMDHTIATLTQATVAFIPHDSLLKVTQRFPGLAAILWRETLIDAAVFRQSIVSLGQRDATGRMAHLFCELYCRLEAIGLATEHRCALPTTQEELADALGISSVHTNRTLMELRKQDLITLRSSILTIKAWNKLAQIAGFNPSYLQLA